MRDSCAVIPLLLSLSLCGCHATTQSLSPGLLEVARTHCAQHQWQEAIDALDDVLQKTPDDVEALQWRAHAFTATEQHEKARLDLAKAMDLGADDAWTHYAHAMALHNLGQLEESLRGYTTALSIDPEFVKAHEWRGFTLTRLGRPLQALPDLDAGVRADTGNAWLRTIRGKVRVSLGDYSGAEEDLWRAADVDAENSDVIAQLGYFLVATGQVESGRVRLERALQLGPSQQAEARIWLYHILTDARLSAEAEAHLDTLRSTTSDLSWPLAIGAFLRRQITAESLLAEAASAPRPQRTQHRCGAWLHIGLVARREGHADAALMAFARAVATDVRDEWEWTWARQCLREVTHETP